MSDASVLVLNRNFQPIHVTNPRRAFSLLYIGAARAMDEQFRMFDFASWAEVSADCSQDVIHTVNRVIRVPRVIILQVYDRMPRTRVRFSRHNIYLRDGSSCQYCGQRLPRSELNLDHVIPRAHGGRTSWENVVCSCIKCNLKKGARTPEQAHMRLRKNPVKPKWTPTFRATGSKVRYREWLPFLDLPTAAYWNAELSED